VARAEYSIIAVIISSTSSDGMPYPQQGRGPERIGS
jgi:hypothetical protein